MAVNAAIRSWFPPVGVTRLSLVVDWRERLRAAVKRSGKKHSVVARDAGIAPETLSRILNATHAQPAFDTIVRIARAVNENVGWILDERGFSLSADEQKQLHKVVRFLDDTLRATHRRERLEPNAVPAGAPGVEIPRTFANRGARLIYEAAGDSMIGAGIGDHDLLFVKPSRSPHEASGRVVICRIDGAEYVKALDVRGGRIRILSRNEQYPPMELAEGSQRFELVGVVVGRIGAV